MLKRLLAYSKVAIPLLLGICIGIALSFIVLPFLEEQSCEWNPKYPSIHDDNNINVKLHDNKDSSKRYSHLMEGVDWDSFRRAEYMPHVIKPPQSGSQTAQRPVRHRFIRSEIDIKDPLYIGYLITASASRGFALNKTVSRPDENELAMKFFFDTKLDADLKRISTNYPSLVSLNLLNSNTLPLLTVKYIYSNTHNYNSYKYYALLPDTVYANAPALTSYVQQLSGQHFIGFPSSLDESVCDLSVGFLISQDILAQVAVNIRRCEQVFQSTHDSMQAMNECLQLIGAPTCVTHPVPIDSPLLEYKLQNNRQALSNTIISQSHAISNVETTAQIHNIRRILAETEMQSIIEEIQNLDKNSAIADGSTSWPPAVNKPFKTANRFDTLRWTLIKDDNSYLQFDHINSQPLTGPYYQLDTEIVREAMATLNFDSKRFKLTKVVHGYRRLDPTRGIEYRLTLDVYDHFLGKDSIKVMEVVKPTTTFEMLPSSSCNKTQQVSVVVPVFGGDPHVSSLVDNFSDLFKVDPHITLQLILIYSADEYKAYQVGESDVFHNIKSIITEKEMQMANGHMIKWRTASHRLSLVELVADTVSTMSATSVVFTSTSSTRLSNQLIERARTNVIEGKQIYAPMAFWQYDPQLITQSRNPSNMIDVARGNGHFGEKWFDHLAFVAQDFQDAKRMSSKTPTSVYELLLTIPPVTVLRAPDADCVVAYHQGSCASDYIDDAPKCTAQKHDNVGSGPILAMNLLKGVNAATKLI